MALQECDFCGYTSTSGRFAVHMNRNGACFATKTTLQSKQPGTKELRLDCTDGSLMVYAKPMRAFFGLIRHLEAETADFDRCIELPFSMYKVRYVIQYAKRQLPADGRYHGEVANFMQYLIPHWEDYFIRPDSPGPISAENRGFHDLLLEPMRDRLAKSIFWDSSCEMWLLDLMLALGHTMPTDVKTLCGVTRLGPPESIARVFAAIAHQPTFKDLRRAAKGANGAGFAYLLGIIGPKSESAQVIDICAKQFTRGLEILHNTGWFNLNDAALCRTALMACNVESVRYLLTVERPACEELQKIVAEISSNNIPGDRAQIVGFLDCFSMLLDYGVKLDSRLYTVAVKMGSLEFLKFLFERDCPIYNGMCVYAAENDSTECLKFLIKHGFPCDSSTWFGALRRGSMSTIRFLHKKKKGCALGSYEVAAKEGHYCIIGLLHELGYPIHPRAISSANDKCMLKMMLRCFDNKPVIRACHIDKPFAEAYLRKRGYITEPPKFA